jgi:hypothetical protein
MTRRTFIHHDPDVYVTRQHLSPGKQHSGRGATGRPAQAEARLSTFGLSVNQASVYADVDRTPMDTRRLQCSFCGNVPKSRTMLMDDGAGGFRCIKQRACEQRGELLA